MATLQERPKTISKTGNEDEFGTLTIHDMLEDGDAYVSRERYTVAQQNEIAELLQEAARAGARAVRPEWKLLVEVERLDGKNAV